jgi:hypothetical protein
MNEPKQKQLQTIKESKVNTKYSLNIKSEEDIYTLQEIIHKYKGSYQITKDLDIKDLKRAIIHSRIVVYSDTNIENGILVSPSYITTKSLLQGKQLYSKKVKIENIAWIDIDKGIYVQTINEE